MKGTKQSTTHQDWSDWHANINPEQESLLLHEEASADLFSASCHITWNNLVERLRDVESPSSLFEGHEVLQEYAETTLLRTIPATALITVSLNNYVAHHNLPFKFCWSHIPFSVGEGDLYMSFGAWSTEEQEKWMASSPGFRAKQCTVWESTIHYTSQTVRIPYTRKAMVSLSRDGIPAIDTKRLTWAANCLGEAGEPYAGELFLQGNVIEAHRGQCSTSKKLYDALRMYYLNSCSHERWHILRLHALAAIRKKRRSSKKHTTTFWGKVGDKIAGSVAISPMVKK